MVTNRRRGNFKSAGGRAIVPARLFNGNAEHFSQERFCNQAGRGMPGSGCWWSSFTALFSDGTEAAAILHDVGNAVSHQRHHKHTFYLVANADIPGFSDRERLLVATVARYHRRSTPHARRPDLADLSPGELSLVRRLSALLRVANTLDASHQQPVNGLRAEASGRAVRLHVRVRGPADLELWEVRREAEFFREVYKKRVEIVARR